MSNLLTLLSRMDESLACGLRESKRHLGASLLNKDGEAYNPKNADDDPIQQGYIYYDPDDIDVITNEALDDDTKKVACYMGNQSRKRYRVHYKNSIESMHAYSSRNGGEFVEPETKELIVRKGGRLEESKYFYPKPLPSTKIVPENVTLETKRYENARTREEFQAMFLMDLMSSLIYGQFPDQFVENGIGILNLNFPLSYKSRYTQELMSITIQAQAHGVFVIHDKKYDLLCKYNMESMRNVNRVKLMEIVDVEPRKNVAVFLLEFVRNSRLFPDKSVVKEEEISNPYSAECVIKLKVDGLYTVQMSTIFNGYESRLVLKYPEVNFDDGTIGEHISEIKISSRMFFDHEFVKEKSSYERLLEYSLDNLSRSIDEVRTCRDVHEDRKQSLDVMCRILKEKGCKDSCNAVVLRYNSNAEIPPTSPHAKVLKKALGVAVLVFPFEGFLVWVFIPNNEYWNHWHLKYEMSNGMHDDIEVSYNILEPYEERKQKQVRVLLRNLGYMRKRHLKNEERRYDLMYDQLNDTKYPWKVKFLHTENWPDVEFTFEGGDSEIELNCNIQYKYDPGSTQFSARFVDVEDNDDESLVVNNEEKALSQWKVFPWKIYEMLRKIGNDHIKMLSKRT